MGISFSILSSVGLLWAVGGQQWEQRGQSGEKHAPAHLCCRGARQSAESALRWVAGAYPQVT